MKTPWLVAPGVFTPLSLSIAGDAAEGVRAADYVFDPVMGTERMKAFGKRHQEKFGVLPNFATACIVQLADDLRGRPAQRRADAGPDPRLLQEASRDSTACPGPITLDADGITTEEPVMRVIREGKFTLLK